MGGLGWSWGPNESEKVRRATSFCLIGNDLKIYSSWPYRQKWAATVVVSSFTLIGYASTSMIAPAASQVAEQFGITSSVLVAMTTSIFVLGYGEYYFLLYTPPYPDFQLLFTNSRWTPCM